MQDLKEISEAISIARDYAKKNHERRLFLIFGFSNSDRVANLISNLLEEGSIIVSDDDRFLNIFGDDVLKVRHKETKSILGRTFSDAVIDLRMHLDVISLSRTVETIRGGGLIFVFLPLVYREIQAKYVEKLKPIGIKENPRDILRRRLLKKALTSDGVYVVSSLILKVLKKPKEKIRNHVTEDKITLPEKSIIPGDIYSLCKTMDQTKVLNAFEKLFEDVTNTILITADRGRGKSASVGLALSGLAFSFFEKNLRPLRVVLTAPELENALEVLRFVKIGLEKLGVKYESSESYVRSKIIDINYVEPYSALFERGDFIIVDEAAGLPFPILRTLLERKEKLIFLTTLHGYEGSGRMFSVRFLPLLKDKRPDYLHVELKRPIRYAENDPVEKWLFDALMLDAEPVDISVEEQEEIVKNIDKIKYERIKPFKYVVGSLEKRMKEVFGILISAHYRNNPNDLLMFADAPHYFGYVGLYEEKPIVAIELGMEGGLSQEEIQVFLKTAPSGHIIPDKLIKYYGELKAAEKRGWRIIRITVHPKLMLRGIGSKTLKFVEEEGKAEGISWIGAGFTGYPELLSFWIKNGYVPIHISPKLNKTTGEHTVIVVKPLDEELNQVIKRASKELKLRLLRELSSTYRNLEAKTALLILKSIEKLDNYELSLSPSQAFRLRLYMDGSLHFESASDAVEDLARYYFAKNLDFLDEESELLLIEAVLKRKKVGIRNLLELRKIIRKLWFSILKVEIEAE